MTVYERKYPVNIFNTDLTGRLSPGALFNFFEDIAGRHALELGWGRDNLMSSGVFWVLSRMVVKVEQLPLAWEEVTLRTWPRGTEAIYALRDLEMYDVSGNRLAGASSSWVIVDYHTRRAQRPDKALSDLQARFPRERATEANARKVPALPAGDHEKTRLKVKLDDIDVNRHVNNARYIQWTVNCYDPEFISTHTLDTIEVNYIAEGHQNEMINIFTAPFDETGTSFIHSVTRESDGSELCRVRMSWKKNRL
ncbi:MAG: acyl-ACP thioesterase domain-containing protein [Bacteroidales bacterium]